MDGSILTVTDGETSYEVLVSIPNLGEEYVSSIKRIEVGRYIQVIGNILKLKDTERIIASQIYVEGAFTGDHPCNLEPDPGRCKAAMPRYYFEEGRCKEFLWGGCDGVVPFDSLDVCIKTCEQGIPDKPDLTKETCKFEGGRVVNTLDGGICNDDEINIGDISGDVDCPCICCMVTGGSATNK
ncbi:BPTI/Kunitz domain-containing protein [Candidatus Woesearchaeota archaeon]|nr:BPTI/Kunitz domain-containing protein [Candidatus Woesearchaeota archaeon]